MKLYILLANLQEQRLGRMTVHPTLSFAIMHAAIHDAVNSIDRTHMPYFLKVGECHEELYPDFEKTLDAHWTNQLLSQIPVESAANRSKAPAQRF